MTKFWVSTDPEYMPYLNTIKILAFQSKISYLVFLKVSVDLPYNFFESLKQLLLIVFSIFSA